MMGRKRRAWIAWFFALLLGLSFWSPALDAQTRISIQQLERILKSRRAGKNADLELARELNSMQLSESLSDSRLSELAVKAGIGPKALEQLGLLAAFSVFEPPPLSEVPQQAPPDSSEQEQAIARARAYAAQVTSHLPDFIALRTAQSFNDLPQFTDKPHSKPIFQLRTTAVHHRRVAFRGGKEVSDAPGREANGGEGYVGTEEGLTTWGEFGPILSIVLGDSTEGTIAWARWQRGADGRLLSVFRYTVPRHASHYLIAFSWYQSSAGRQRSSRFTDCPAYHGELAIDSASGAILRITIEADLDERAPIRTSKMSVQYGSVAIGTSSFICPVRGIAVGSIYDFDMESLYEHGTERFINIVHFTDYHKFGSTARMVSHE